MENEDGTITIKDIGLERLDEYGLWLQVIDESGQEVFSHNKPVDYPSNYSASELVELAESEYENGNTVFVSSFEESGHTWNYIIGFPYAIGKYMLYYNGETVSRLSPVFRVVLFSTSFVGISLFLIYVFGSHAKWEKYQEGLVLLAFVPIRNSRKKAYSAVSMRRSIKWMRKFVKAISSRMKQSVRVRNGLLISLMT